MAERFITPSKITAWLDCAHVLTLTHEVEDGTRDAPSGAMGAFGRLLMDKGLAHEQSCLESYRAQGLSVFEVPGRERAESFAAWVARVGNPMADGHDVIYQLPMVHDGIRGVADFLIRVQEADGGFGYEPVDAKLARKAAKPGHVLQLCFYADAIEALTGHRPEHMHLWLGSGVVERLRVADVAAYWRRMRRQLATVVSDTAEAVPSRPEPCDHCAFCTFADTCDAQWREEDSLLYVSGLRAAERPVLEAAGVSTLTALAGRVEPVPGLRPERLSRLVGQARLQGQAVAGSPPPHEAVPPSDDPVWGQGYATMPAPDDGDVFLDFEGHPFWRADAGLLFLFGLIERDGTGAWSYRTWWAHDADEETARAAELIDHLAARRAQHPGMHVYHYNHTERSALMALATERGVGEATLLELVETGAFVDLYLVVRNALQVGAESYGLKVVEQLAAYERGHEIDAGAGAVLEYEQYMTSRDQASLDRIAAYNADDVRATLALRDWLVAQRPVDLPWREAVLPLPEDLPELDEQVARLHEHAPDSPEYLLGDVLGYWRREWLACLAPKLAACTADTGDLLDAPDVLAGLVPGDVSVALGKNGKPLKHPRLSYTLPPQDTSAFTGGDKLVFVGADGTPGYSSVCSLDADAGTLTITYPEAYAELGPPPTVLVRNDWLSPKPKPAALAELAAAVLDPQGAPNQVSMALLRRDVPTVTAGAGPVDGRFSDDLDEMLAAVLALENSCLAIQGPPGTGKTFRGAHLVLALVRAGKRVGITSFSHHAIDNLLEEVVRVFTEADELHLLSVARKVTKAPAQPLAGVTYVTGGNSKLAKSEYTVVAGTTWPFAGDDLAANPVDVLLIDEAGQLSLADALAACRSAHNVVLLGDPLQLPQVAQASHPHGSGASVLEHVLGDERTLPPERGVFLRETRRMHPDVCTFISEEIYESRLTSHPSCAGQSTALGTGLRWLRAEHTGRVTESPEEAELVLAQVLALMGQAWTDQHGRTRPMTPADVLVVAPYNDQVHLLRAVLDADPRSRGVTVGTVDKFQGRQAAVVIFSMTTSTAADMHRSAGFLFSRERLNVAISRARCLAYLVSTEALLDSRGRDVEEMRLISTLCSFVERCPSPAATLSSAGSASA